ncbi:MAG: DUF2219 family protein [Paracoccaceae bacterium]|nr:DUF2219 family protein [Paracoccaceae bacterium]
MRKVLLPAVIALFSLMTPALAQDRVSLGFGRLFTNDAIGDGRDRWRTGAYAVSLLRGQSWHGDLPQRFGEMLEFRIRSEIIAPANLSNPSKNDRRYAGVIAPGVHTHFALGRLEARLGADLVFTGPQTGVSAFQRNVHDLLGMKKPGGLGNQIPNKVNPTLSGEIGQSFRLGEAAMLRPFAEGQAGVESYVRLGGDLVIGGFGRGALMLRDPITGQRYWGIEGDSEPGFSLTLGGDVARMFDSEYLPEGGNVQLRDTRTRLRAGVHWRGEKSEVFYGLTRLGKEFDSQPEAQTVGSVRVKIRF